MKEKHFIKTKGFRNFQNLSKRINSDVRVEILAIFILKTMIWIQGLHEMDSQGREDLVMEAAIRRNV